MLFPDPIIDNLGPAELVFGPMPKRMQRYLDIYDQQGRAARFCRDRSGSMTTLPMAPHIDGLTPEMRGEGGAVLEEPALYAGLAHDQFGFAILQSLGRLWACDKLPKETRLLYVSKFRPRKVLPPLRALLGWLGIENMPVFVQGNMHLAQAHTCPSLFGESHEGHAAPAFREWLETRLPPAPDMVTGRKLYITRTKLGPHYGRMACEQQLEEFLRRDGFEIFAPEAHSLAQQAETYRQAEVLVFSEGSAQHFYGLVKRAGQRIVVIQRRPEVPELIKTQLTAINDEPVTYINAIDKLHWRLERADNRGICELDFDQLRTQLIAADVLNAQAEWQSPTSSAVTASIHDGLPAGERMYGSAAEAAAERKLRLPS